LEYTGNVWNHTPISTPVSYWVRSFTSGDTYNVGETENIEGGGPFGNASYVHYLVFDAYQPFKLVSVEVNAQYAGDRQIALRDASANVISMKSVYCPAGVSRIILDMDVPSGLSLQLVGMNAPDLFRTNETGTLYYPYEIDGVCSIIRSSASQNPTGFYYYFYDWEIESYTCESEPIMITVSVANCSTSIIGLLSESIAIYPVPSRDWLFFKGLDNSKEVTVSVLDNRGRIVLMADALENNGLNISSLPQGSYVVCIKTLQTTVYRKIIKL
jgi:hypothetical protein